MAKIEFDASLFSIYAHKVKEQISLLDNFQLPPSKSWIIDWAQLKAFQQLTRQNNWNQLPVYRDLLINKNSPSIYYFTNEKKDAQRLFELLKKSKQESSYIRREKGVKEKGFYSISHVPKLFQEGDCIYVGSRKINIHERFKQHLGYGSGRTGALHLSKVFSLEESIPEITFHYHILDKKYLKITEHIECVVQNSLKPFIGKKLLEN